MFTIIKQLFCNFINNANHIRRRYVSLLTNIQTTLLQLINHFNHLSNLLTSSTRIISLQTFIQLVNIISKNNIFAKHLDKKFLANNLLRFIQTIYRQANKMLINHLQEIYSLRYGMRCKQDG